MASSSKAAIDELVSYLRAYSLAEQMQSKELAANVRTLAKCCYALRLWSNELINRRPWQDDKDRSDLFRLYYRESVSDDVQGLLLWAQGLYKPSFLILRSGLENFVKSLGIAQDQNVLQLSSVFDLIEVVKNTSLVLNNSIVAKQFNVLHSEYGSLCNHVHTSSSSEMALTEMVGVYPRYAFGDASRASAVFLRVYRAKIAILCVMFWDKFHRMHHTHFDAISEAMTRTTKKALFN